MSLGLRQAAAKIRPGASITLLLILGRPAAGQAPNRPDALAAAYRALVLNVTAVQSAHARYGTWDRAGYDTPRDPQVRVMFLTNDSTGWSAVAAHRAFPDLRCGAALGDAPPPFGSRDRLVCVDENGQVSTPATDRSDTAMVFWWRDPRLKIDAPEQTCPALPISRQTGRNDTLYLSFVVARDSRLEISSLEIESTAGFDAALGAVHMLEGCTFHPAVLDGRFVRTARRAVIALDPSSTQPPTWPGAAAPDLNPPEWPISAGPVNEVRARLAALVPAQETYRSREGAYAPSPSRATGGGPDRGPLWVAQFAWSAERWEAVARHDSIPWVTCRVEVLAGGPPPGVVCSDSRGIVLPDTVEDVRPDVSFKPPELRSCNRYYLPRGRGSSSAVVEILLGANGRPDPRAIRVAEATDLFSVGGAIQYLSTCRYWPARMNGKAVPTLIRQPFIYQQNRP